MAEEHGREEAACDVLLFATTKWAVGEDGSRKEVNREAQ